MRNPLSSNYCIKVKKSEIFILTMILLFTFSLFLYSGLELIINHEKPNVVIIIADTIRKDYLSYYNHLLDGTSPNIDSLMNESMVFDRAYSQAGWTVPSVFSLFTSLYPKDHKIITWNQVLDDTIITLTEVLKNNGYITFGYPCLFSFNDTSGMQKGFDFYRDNVLDLGMPHNMTTAEHINKLVLDDLNAISSSKLDKPFFMWIHYFDAHTEYLIHENFYYGMASPQRYRGEISYVDMHIGQIISKLKEKELYNNTLIIFVSDHGEEFGEHGQWNVHRTLFEEVVEIPFSIKFPKVKKEDLINVMFTISHIDISTFLLDYLNIRIPKQFKGRTIEKLSKSRNYPIIMERGGDGEVPLQTAIIYKGYKLYKIDLTNCDTTSNRYKTSYTYFDKNGYMLFNLFNDRLERINILHDNRPMIGFEMLDILKQYRKDDKIGNEKLMIKTEKLIDNLKALGYITPMDKKFKP